MTKRRPLTAKGATWRLAAAIPLPPDTACRVSKRCCTKAACLVQPSSFSILLQHQPFLPSHRADDPKLLDAFCWLIHKEARYEGLQAASPETRPCQSLMEAIPP